jgi:hypothetical protein
MHRKEQILRFDIYYLFSYKNFLDIVKISSINFQYLQDRVLDK